MPQGAKKRALDDDSSERYRREVAERVYLAFERYNSGVPRSGKLSQADLGRLVAQRLRKPTIPQATVSRWMSETSPVVTDPPTIRAIAEVLNVDVMWLLYGAITD